MQRSQHLTCKELALRIINLTSLKSLIISLQKLISVWSWYWVCPTVFFCPCYLLPLFSGVFWFFSDFQKFLEQIPKFPSCRLEIWGGSRWGVHKWCKLFSQRLTRMFSFLLRKELSTAGIRGASAGMLFPLLLDLNLLHYWRRQIIVQHFGGAQGLSIFTTK